METLHQASNQWANRPDDERFATVADLHAACETYRKEAAEKTLPAADLRVEADGGDLRLVGRAGIPASLTNYSFGQLCALARTDSAPDGDGRGAPASYLSRLPATL